MNQLSADPLRAIEDALKSGERSARKAEVARRLGVGLRTLERWMANGLPATYVGCRPYIAWADVAAFVRKGQPKPKRQGRPDTRQAVEILRRHGYKVPAV